MVESITLYPVSLKTWAFGFVSRDRFSHNAPQNHNYIRFRYWLPGYIIKSNIYFRATMINS